MKIIILLVVSSINIHAACLADVDMGNYQINNSIEPTSDQDAATKKYVDDLVLNTFVPELLVSNITPLPDGSNPIDFDIPENKNILTVSMRFTDNRTTFINFAKTEEGRYTKIMPLDGYEKTGVDYVSANFSGAEFDYFFNSSTNKGTIENFRMKTRFSSDLDQGINKTYEEYDSSDTSPSSIIAIHAHN